MRYIELDVTCQPHLNEICIALLAEAGCDSFAEAETGFKAYVPESQFDERAVSAILSEHGATFTVAHLPDVNWNAEWEKNFPPVEVTSECIICAPFHQLSRSYTHRIVVQPQMSFGTGHHPTTRLMLQAMLGHPFTGIRVFDFGTGTGILAILAAQLGASELIGVDNDEWSYRNAQENFALNKLTGIDVRLGELNDVSESGFDVILANINKNVLMDTMPVLSGKLNTKGSVLMSGFFDSDVADLQKRAAECALKCVDCTTENGWAMARFVKT